MLDIVRQFSSQVFALPRIRTAHWLALAVCLLTGAGANLYRTAWRPAGDATAFRGFNPTTGVIDGQTVRWTREYSKAEVLGFSWRPMRWRVQLIAPPGAPGSTWTTWLSVNDVRVKRVSAGRGWQTIEFTADPPSATDVALQFNTTVNEQGLGIGVGRVSVEPVFTVANVLLEGLAGALAGFVLWLVLVLKPVAPAARAETALVPNWSLAHAVSILLIVCVYLGMWAVLKPPLQSPDEPQHLIRANSVLLQPWATRTPNWLTLDPRFLNPLVQFPPDAIGKLFFNNLEHLTLERVAAMKAYAWMTAPPPLQPYYTPLATYPTGYYAPVFALAEGTTKVLGLTPYQNTFAYRGWTVLLTALLWLAVYRVLLVTPGTQSRANVLFGFLLLNPMLAFISSSATPDSVNVPLATLGVLLTYRTLMTGKHAWVTTIALIACALTKPSILLIFASLPLPALLLWRKHAIAFRHVFTAGLAAARAAVIVWCAFYAWSPPRFFGGKPETATLAAYADKFIERLPDLWISYWGRLGWLDYELNGWWYTALSVLVLIAMVIAVRRTKGDARQFASFAALFGACYFAVMTIGEYWYLPMAGYNFQGRHLFPACIALGGLVVHENRYVRWTIVGWIGLMNLVLIWLSFQRYFGGDWRVFLAALP